MSLIRGAQGKVSAVGFKIGLEIYVKCGVKKHSEVQIFFGKREAGESKLTGKVMLYYVLHLTQLYRFRFPLLLPAIVLCVIVMMLWFSAVLFRPKDKLL